MPQQPRTSRFSKFVKNGMLLCLTMAALLPAVAPAQASQDDVLGLPWNQWQMHIGDDAQCAQIDAPACTGQPLHFERWGSPNQWQRIQVTLPAHLQSVPSLGLLVQGEYPVYEVFINGQRVGSSGDFAARRGPQYTRATFNFPSSLASQGRLVIAIHSLGIHSSNHIDDGPIPTIASVDLIQFVRDTDTVNYLHSSWLHYLCYAAMLGASVVFFLLYSVNTRLHENFWLGARLCSLGLFRIFELASVVNLSMPAWLALTCYAILNAGGAIFSIEFVFSFLGRPVTKSFRAIEIVGAGYLAYLLLFLPLPTPLFFPFAGMVESTYLQATVVTAVLLAALSFLLVVPVCFRSKLPEMRWIGGAVLIFAVEETNRMLFFLRLPSMSQNFFWHGVDIDLRALANLLFAIVMLVAMTFRLRRIQDRNRQVEQEIAAARSVQQILIPDQLPSIAGLHIESAYLPAQEVGGDFFQILPIPNAADPERSSAFIILGDVSGKGLKAAMTVSMIVGTLRAFAESYRSPGELLSGLNRLLHNRGDGFVTCLALMIEPSGKITLANAAHLNPYINGSEIQTDPNLPLGPSLDVSYAEITLHLEPGQACTLITDGVVEAASAASRELFGFDRTQAISTRSASDIAEAARVFGEGAPQADDITVLTIARTAAAQPALV